MFNTYDVTRPYDNQMGYPEYLIDRFWLKVDVKKFKNGKPDLNNCMIWKAALLENGYGIFYDLNKNIKAHRFSYQCYNGPIPEFNEFGEKLCVRHKVCNNPMCVNPLHLKIGTNQQNSDDMVELDRQARGSIHGNSVFDDDEIADMLIDIYNDKYSTLDEISNKYSVDRRTIGKILKGQTWTHISKPVCKYLGCDLLKLERKVSKSKSKLNINKVKEIRRRLNMGEKIIDLSKEFKVAECTISQVKNNKTWKNVV
jgi:hypothetical protein